MLMKTAGATRRAYGTIGFPITKTLKSVFVSGGSTTTVTISDGSYSRVTPATADILYDVSWQLPLTFPNSGEVVGAASIINLTPSIVSIASDGTTTRIADGNAAIQIKVRRLGSERVDFPVVRSAGQIVDTFQNYISGSAARNATDNIDTVLSGKTLQIYSSQNHTTRLFVRSATCWAAAYDLTAISPSNDYANNLCAGTLISPRHLVLANHFTVPVGTKFYFVDASNVTTFRTATAVTNIFGTDISLVTLNSDVAVGIGFCKLLPANYATYFPNLFNGVPCLCLDQEEKALIIDFYGISNNSAVFRKPTAAGRLTFYEDIIGGDSGNPALMIISGSLVLVTTWTGGYNSPNGPNYEQYISALNTAMAGIYTITTVNLSGFTAF